MEIKDKLIRKFKDTENNIYEIKQKYNKHYYLTIKEKNKNGAKIINGSKYKIFTILKEIHKNTKFIDI